MIFLHIKVKSSENPYEMFRNMGLGINSNFSPKTAHGRFHRKMFGPPRPLQCQVCRATFEKQSALTSHSCYTNFIPTKVRYVNIIIFDLKNSAFHKKNQM